MGKKYIDVEALGIGMARAEIFANPEYARGWNNAIEIINNAPVADVIEKKHGYWKKRIIENEEEDYPIRNVDYICSRCGGCWHEPLKYCPNCLAEMDKEETDA